MFNFDLPGFLGGVLASVPKAGDVLLAVGCPPQVRVDGNLVRLRLEGLERLTPFQTEAIVLHLLALAPPSAAARVRKEGAAHFAYSVPAVSRFRVAVFCQRGTYAVSLRAIPERVPALGELKLPAAMRDACGERDGVILVNGPAGAGRSTSLAAMLGEINAHRSCHVLTVEDPIEFLHRHGAATVNQREVGYDTPSAAQGLVDALQQDAQVLVVSEARTKEEVALILDAAETGHLVLTSVRAFDTASALRRLLSPFSPEERAEVRGRLARVLRWSFTQHLLPHRDGRRPVVEVWKTTHTAIDALLDGPLDSGSIADVLHDGEGEGLIAFDRVLERRVREGELELDAALASAVLPRQLESRLLDLHEPREGGA